MAAEGAELAKKAGFDAEAAVAEGSPIWKAIVDGRRGTGRLADRDGLARAQRVGYMAMGSVATSVAHHAKIPVLICRQAR